MNFKRPNSRCKEIKKAILNDSKRQTLFKELIDLYTKASPVAFEKDDTIMLPVYSCEVERSAKKIMEQIRLRQRQIIEEFSENIK